MLTEDREPESPRGARGGLGLREQMLQEVTVVKEKETELFFSCWMGDDQSEWKHLCR